MLCMLRLFRERCLPPALPASSAACLQRCLLPTLPASSAACFQRCLLPALPASSAACFQRCLLPAQHRHRLKQPSSVVRGDHRRRTQAPHSSTGSTTKAGPHARPCRARPRAPRQHGHVGVVMQGQAGAARQAEDAQAQVGVLVHVQVRDHARLPVWRARRRVRQPGDRVSGSTTLCVLIAARDCSCLTRC